MTSRIGEYEKILGGGASLLCLVRVSCWVSGGREGGRNEKIWGEAEG